MRNFLRLQDSDDKLPKPAEAAQANHPQWLYQKLQKNWPAAWADIVDYNNAAPPMTLRVNLNRSSRAAYQAQLIAAGIDSETDDYCDTALRLRSAVNISALPDFAEGTVSVQDVGAQLAASLLNVDTNMRVLDACAAPGGKAVNLLEKEESITLTCLLYTSDAADE